MNMNVLLDLPSCLLQEIFSKWLNIIEDSTKQQNMRTLLRLDSALCNKKLRIGLPEIFSLVNWEKFLVCEHSIGVGLKMVWIVARNIPMPTLVLSNYPDDRAHLKLFFERTGKSLQVLKLTDFKGAMTELTKAVAKHCKLLNTLCLERCNLTVPIADILNRTQTITELRIQNKTPAAERNRRMRRAERPPATTLKRSLLEKITCHSVTKLALLDQLQLDDVEAVAKAFPNVTDIELSNVLSPVLIKLLEVCKNIQVLRLVEMKQIDAAVVDAVADGTHDSLRKIVFEQTEQSYSYVLPSAALTHMLTRCTHLTSVVFNGSYIIDSAILIAIAEHCNTRLIELSVGDWTVSDAAVAAIAEHCPNLQVLVLPTLCHHNNYTDVLMRCTQLHTLIVKGQKTWYNSTSESQQSFPQMGAIIQAIATYCTHLQVLGLLDHSAPRASLGVLYAPLRKLNKLRKLYSLSYCGAQWKDLPGVLFCYRDYIERRRTQLPW